MYNEDSKMSGIMLSPKMSFILGLGAGVLVICSIGFFVLLSLFVGGERVSLGTGDAYAAQQPTNNVPAQLPAGQVGPFKEVGKDDHVRGSAKAKVTLIEYSDFQCPFCSQFHPTLQQILKDYGDDVRWVYRHYPLTSIHPQAVPSANAAECASEQGKFFEYADALFANQASLSDAYYGQLADQLKLNRKKFDDCYGSRKYQSVVDAHTADGSGAGVSGTPATILVAADGSAQLLEGALPYASVKAMVDAALAK